MMERDGSILNVRAQRIRNMLNGKRYVMFLKNAAGSGDLHVRVQLWTPDTLSNEEEQLIARLGEIQRNVPADRGKGLWAKMKEALGA